MSPHSEEESAQIGVLNEQPLHAALKMAYALPGSRLEAEVDGFVVDVAQDDQLIEVQTGNFSSIKRKMTCLASNHPLLLVYPIPRERWLLKLPKEDGGEMERRKSPKRGRPEEVFKELVSFPRLMCRDTFALEVVLTQEEELRRYDPDRWRNRGWVTVERRLLEVVDRQTFRSPEDLAALLPQDLPARFTTADLAEAMDGPRWLAQKMAYCLRKMDAIVQIGKRGRSNLYTHDRG